MPTPKANLESSLKDVFGVLMSQATMEKTILDVIPDIADAIDTYVRETLVGSQMIVRAGVPVQVDIASGIGETSEDAVVEVENVG